MGDRANLKLIGGDTFPHPVFFYTHWTGSMLLFDLHQGMTLAAKEGRLDDPQYLGRILFEAVVPEEEHGETTGYGISTEVCDGADRTITVDLGESKVVHWTGQSWSFKEFLKLTPGQLKAANDPDWADTAPVFRHLKPEDRPKFVLRHPLSP